MDMERRFAELERLDHEMQIEKRRDEDRDRRGVVIAFTDSETSAADARKIAELIAQNQLLSDSAARPPVYRLPTGKLQLNITYKLEFVTTGEGLSDHNVMTQLCGIVCRNYHDYNGFVVLKEDAQIEALMSKLSFALERNARSVVFVRHFGELADALNDIDRDLRDAIEVSCGHQLPEVALYENSRLLRATRVRRDMFDNLVSPNHGGLGDFRDGRFHPRYKEILNVDTGTELNYWTEFDPSILVLALVPNQSPQLFDVWKQSDARAIIIESYGIGNVPKAYKQFAELIEFWRKSDKLMFSYSQCDKGSVHKSYETSFEGLGIHSCSDMTPAAAFSKLSYLLAKGYENGQIVEKMGQNLRGETGVNSSELFNRGA